MRLQLGLELYLQEPDLLKTRCMHDNGSRLQLNVIIAVDVQLRLVNGLESEKKLTEVAVDQHDVHDLS